MTKTVHFLWKDENPPEYLFPEWWRRTWEESGWSICLWTDSDIARFADEQSDEIRSLFNGYKLGVMRSDAFRYLLLKEMGGLYVDLDFVNLASMDWILGMNSFACADQGDGCLCNAFMWAPNPNDPFFSGIETSLLLSASEQNPVSATGPQFLTAHSKGRAFIEIPTPWVYPMPWDSSEEIALARQMNLEDLRTKYPCARAIHIWTRSWFNQCGL